MPELKKAKSVQKNNPPNVTKEAITSEMKSTLMNIQSLIQQLLAEEGAEYAPEAEPMKEAMKAAFTSAEAPKNPNDENEENEDEDMDEVMKAIIEGDPDASTASSTAEERQEDLPKWDEENVDEVAKALMRMLTKSKEPVRKSISAKADSRDLMMLSVAKAVNKIAERVGQQDLVLKDMLEGLGVAKTLEQPQAAADRPIRSSDNSMVAKELINALFQAAGQNGIKKEVLAAPVEVARKNMSEFATAVRGLWPEA